jgi:hypothetical protein
MEPWNIITATTAFVSLATATINLATTLRRRSRPDDKQSTTSNNNDENS